MWGVFLGYFRIWQIAVLNILPVALLMLLCYGITGRTWAAAYALCAWTYYTQLRQPRQGDRF